MSAGRLGQPANRDQDRGWYVSKRDNLLDFLAAQLANDETAWSVGCFGAIAEFMRDFDEAVTFQRAAGSIAAVTARGGLRIEVSRRSNCALVEELDWPITVRSRQ